MNQWSSYQLAIFKNVEEGKGHTVVLARAGSGKTTTIVEALKHIPVRKTVLMVAFNKKIKEELEKRAPSSVEVETLHGYGYRQIRNRFGRVQISKWKMEQIFRKELGEEKYDEEKWPSLEEAQEAGETSWEVDYSTWIVVNAMTKTASLAKACLVGLVENNEDDDEYEKAVQAVDDIMDTYAIDPGYGDEGCQTCSGNKRTADGKRCPECKGQGVVTSQEMRRDFVETVMWGLAEAKKDTQSIDFDDMIWFPIVHKLRCWQFDRVFVDETQDLSPGQVELALLACKRDGRICAVGDDRQCIYEWRGADIDTMGKIVDRLHAKVMKLTVCYRCASSIVEEASKVVPDFEPAPGAIRGLVKDEVTESEMRSGATPGDFILSRTNAPLIALCWSLIREGRPATIQGRDFAGSLIGMIKKARRSTVRNPQTKRVESVQSVDQFLDWIDEWQTVEVERLKKKRKDTSSVEDRVACFEALCDGCRSLDEVIAKTEALFGDADDDKKKIVLSSTHRAKGLERPRVWVLRDTYRWRPGIEEENLWYVAVTRAQSELYLVSGVGGVRNKKWSVKRT